MMTELLKTHNIIYDVNKITSNNIQFLFVFLHKIIIILLSKHGMTAGWSWPYS